MFPTGDQPKIKGIGKIKKLTFFLVFFSLAIFLLFRSCCWSFRYFFLGILPEKVELITGIVTGSDNLVSSHIESTHSSRAVNWRWPDHRIEAGKLPVGRTCRHWGGIVFRSGWFFWLRLGTRERQHRRRNPYSGRSGIEIHVIRNEIKRIGRWNVGFRKALKKKRFKVQRISF